MTRRINRNKIVSKMNASQLLRFIELGQCWLLPESEVKRRTALVQDTIIDYSSVSATFDKFFKLKGTAKSIKPALIMVHLRPISDVMLADFIQGLCEFMLFLGSKNEEHAQNCETLMRPSLNKLQEFLESDLWRNLIIGFEVTGEESQTINGMTIPFSPEAILMHIERIGAFPLIADDIASIKSDFMSYNESLYAKKDKSSVFDQLDSLPQFSFDPVVISRVYSECLRFELITVTLVQFILAITLANFTNVVFTPEYKGQHLFYSLSKTMGQSWYTEVTSKSGWRKGTCSGHKQRLEHDKWARALKRLFPESD